MEQLFKFINNLNSGQRAIIIGGFSLLFVFLIGLLIYSNIKAEDKKLNYTIATNLTKNQVMMASDELEASGIKFAIIGTGNSLTLKTSKEFINIAKIKLVTSDASTSKHVGWEIFEKSSLGTTNFENKIKYLRALEGELSRSLESLNGILRANVKIAIPKDTIFTQRKADPTASAVLSIKPGVFLTQKQIDGIKNFIASAVTNLKDKNIKLIDQEGSLLEKSGDDINNQKSLAQNKYKKKLEEEYEQKVVALLEPFVGIGRVVARVSISLTFVNRRVQEEIYEPEGTIRSQQTTENTSSTKEEVKESGGVAGVQSNIEDPKGGDDASDLKANSESSKNIINYEISKKIVEQEDNAYSSIARITASVTFDSTVLKDVENRTEFLENMTSIVQNTIGFDDKRGDKITVKDFKFIGMGDFDVKDASGVDSDGNLIVEDDSLDTISMVRSLLKDFSEYIQYIIAAILLFIFYKRFIVNHEVQILSDTQKGDGKVDADGLPLDNDADNFDLSGATGRLKSKIKSQILTNISGLDEESAAKYEILIEELDKEINNNPGEIASMIEMLLTEGDSKFKG